MIGVIAANRGQFELWQQRRMDAAAQGMDLYPSEPAGPAVFVQRPEGLSLGFTKILLVGTWRQRGFQDPEFDELIRRALRTGYCEEDPGIIDASEGGVGVAYRFTILPPYRVNMVPTNGTDLGVFAVQRSALLRFYVPSSAPASLAWTGALDEDQYIYQQKGEYTFSRKAHGTRVEIFYSASVSALRQSAAARGFAAAEDVRQRAVALVQSGGASTIEQARAALNEIGIPADQFIFSEDELERARETQYRNRIGREPEGRSLVDNAADSINLADQHFENMRRLYIQQENRDRLYIREENYILGSIPGDGLVSRSTIEVTLVGKKRKIQLKNL